jgi:hypothetical protein
MVKRLFVRILVAVALCMALLALALAPIPKDLPPPAFGQASLYRLEVALMVFYGDLLLITPAFAGLLRGRLPIEISTRGAKFAEETDQIAAREEAAIKRLDRTIEWLEQELSNTHIELEQLKAFVGRDSTQPEVHSER